MGVKLVCVRALANCALEARAEVAALPVLERVERVEVFDVTEDRRDSAHERAPKVPGPNCNVINPIFWLEYYSD